MRLAGIAGLFVSLVLGLIVVSSLHTASAQQPLTGEVPSRGGVGLVVFAGGSLEQLDAAAAAQGCDLQSVWVTVGGRLVGHIPGAPAFVNADFNATVGTSIPPNTPLLIACEPGTVPGSPPTSIPAGAQEATVVEVDDGDTIKVQIGGTVETVRLVLADTPEVFFGAECYGAEASAFTKAQLPPGTTVFLERDVSERDQFGRLLRYVWLPDGTLLNELLVRQGFATVATFPPDVARLDQLLAAEDEAQAEGRGLWSACFGATPTPTPAAGPCDASYPDVCIPPPPPDLNCGDIEHRNFRVVGSDPHGFDTDRDGIGCES